MSSSLPPPRDMRVQDLELQVHDLQSEVIRLREEVADLARVASMASDEAQQATLRMDNMEHEWLLWDDGLPERGTSSTAVRTDWGAAHTDGAHPTEPFASDPRGTPPAPECAAGRRSADEVVQQSWDSGA